jgi:hypothetical protein
VAYCRYGLSVRDVEMGGALKCLIKCSQNCDRNAL